MSLVVAASLMESARAQELPGASNASELVPPRIIRSTEAVYPPDKLSEGQEPKVVLSIVLDVHGHPQEVQVEESAGEAFDAAAVESVRGWEFEPARRGLTPVASRVRVAVQFALPTFKVLPALDAGLRNPPKEEGLDRASQGTRGDTAPTPPSRDNDVQRFGATAFIHSHPKHIPPRAASDFVVERDVLAAAPHRDVGDLLSSVPGVFIQRIEGDAVAHKITLRGFDAEHGQDIEITAAGIPVNLPSHIHGQGYADLNFIPPEAVRSIRATEGVYDPRQGDFAVAGSLSFDLGVQEKDRGILLKSNYGSFNSFRQLLLWAPKKESEETFGAFAFQRSNGFGQNRSSQSALSMGQYRFGTNRTRAIVHAAAYGGRANSAGVLRDDDIQSGRVGFYDVYPFATAQSQSALASKFQLGFTLDQRGKKGSRFGFAAWAMFNDLRLRENFTGFTQRSRQNPTWVGRGDLIEQSNASWSFGLRGNYRTPAYHPTEWAHGFLEVGMASRADLISQQQNLLQSPQNETWDRRIDASVRSADLGAWFDLDWQLTRYVHLRGGFRADALVFNIDDKLGNFIPAFNRETYIIGFRRTALGLAMGPRATAEVQALPWLTVLASYGEGYRSPQALQLEEAEKAPFAKVRAAEGGFRMQFGTQDTPWLSVTGAVFWTGLSSDLVFDPQEGSLERVGPTTRVGTAIYAKVVPVSWLLGSVSLTYVHASLDKPPPPTAEDPTPPFRSGELLPFVPPVVLRVDASAHHDLVMFRGASIDGRLGMGFTYLSPRPLPFGQSASPVALWDLSAWCTWRAVEVGLEVLNVLGSQYAAAEFFHVSNWSPEAIPSRLPARHIAAGSPRTIMGNLVLHL